MSVRLVSAKTGNVSLALGCCRLSVTFTVRKIIPSSKQVKSLGLVFGQAELRFTQQEGCYLFNSNPLMPYLIDKEDNKLTEWVEQRLCQVTRERFLS